MVEITKELDLTKLKALSGQLDRMEPLELLLVTNYRMLTDADHNTLAIVTELIAKHLYKSEDKTKHDDIIDFFKEKGYTTTLIKFLSTLEHLLLSNTSPYVQDIEFVSVVSEDPYIVKFKYSY